jgi:hypothetical protein
MAADFRQSNIFWIWNRIKISTAIKKLLLNDTLVFPSNEVLKEVLSESYAAFEQLSTAEVFARSAENDCLRKKNKIK